MSWASVRSHKLSAMTSTMSATGSSLGTSHSSSIGRWREFASGNAGVNAARSGTPCAPGHVRPARWRALPPEAVIRSRATHAGPSEARKRVPSAKLKLQATETLLAIFLWVLGSRSGAARRWQNGLCALGQGGHATACLRGAGKVPVSAAMLHLFSQGAHGRKQLRLALKADTRPLGHEDATLRDAHAVGNAATGLD